MEPDVFILAHQRDEFRQALADCQLALSAANAKCALLSDQLAARLDALEAPSVTDPATTR